MGKTCQLTFIYYLTTMTRQAESPNFHSHLFHLAHNSNNTRKYFSFSTCKNLFNIFFLNLHFSSVLLFYLFGFCVGSYKKCQHIWYVYVFVWRCKNGLKISCYRRTFLFWCWCELNNVIKFVLFCTLSTTNAHKILHNVLNIC